MRLWHKRLIEWLPRQQLVGQLRECVLIAKNIGQGNTEHIHCLIDPALNYSLDHFNTYVKLVIDEIEKRGYKISPSTIAKLESYTEYNGEKHVNFDDLFAGWHDGVYFYICFYNLLEKYKCGAIPEIEWLDVMIAWKNYNPESTTGDYKKLYKEKV